MCIFFSNKGQLKGPFNIVPTKTGHISVSAWKIGLLSRLPGWFALELLQFFCFQFLANKWYTYSKVITLWPVSYAQPPNRAETEMGRRLGYSLESKSEHFYCLGIQSRETGRGHEANLRAVNLYLFKQHNDEFKDA